MKKQTESFYIDLEKVDRVKAEKVINAAGGDWDVKYPLTNNSIRLFFSTLDNTFFYREYKYDVGKEITSLSELKKQLGLVPIDYSTLRHEFKIYAKTEKEATSIQKFIFENGGLWVDGDNCVMNNYGPWFFWSSKHSCELSLTRYDSNCDNSLPQITIDQLIKPMKKEYVLNQDVSLDGENIIWKKGTEVKFAYRLNGESFFLTKSHEEDMPCNSSVIFPEKHVEEKQQLLSDVVTFGDKLKCSDCRSYKFAGIKGELGEVIVYDVEIKKSFSVTLDEFNKRFKLK